MTDYAKWKTKVLTQFQNGEEMEYNFNYHFLLDQEYNQWVLRGKPPARSAAQLPEILYFNYLSSLLDAGRAFEKYERLRIYNKAQKIPQIIIHTPEYIKMRKERKHLKRSRQKGDYSNELKRKPRTRPEPTENQPASPLTPPPSSPLTPPSAPSSAPPLVSLPSPPRPAIQPASPEFAIQTVRPLGDQVVFTEDEKEQIDKLTDDEYKSWYPTSEGIAPTFQHFIFKQLKESNEKRAPRPPESVEEFLQRSENRQIALYRTSSDKSIPYVTFLQSQVLAFRESLKPKEIEPGEDVAIDATQLYRKLNPVERKMYEIDKTTDLQTAALTLQFWRIVYNCDRFAPQRNLKGQSGDQRTRIDELLAFITVIVPEQKFEMPVAHVKTYCGQNYLLPNQRLGTAEECRRKGIYVGNTHGNISARS